MSAVLRRGLTLVGTLVAGLAAVAALAAPAHAEQITRIAVAVAVNADTSMRIVETIDYDFGYEDKHGIYRDIPTYDESLTGMRRTYGVTVSGVTMDGEPVPWETSEEGRNLRVKIGDPNRTITGEHSYVIDYTVRNGLRVINADDVSDPQMPSAVSEGDVEMYWDVVGTGWEVDITDASAVVTGPAVPLAVACYWGVSGSTDECPTTAQGTVVEMGGIRLAPYEGITAAIVYPRSAFSVDPVEDLSQGVPSDPAAWLVVGSGLALLLVLVPAIVAMSLRRKDKGVAMAAVPPQYAPPDGLAAAEMVAAWKGPRARSDSRVLVATLVDLAARGWIALATDGSLVVTRLPAGTGDLRAWERAFLDGFFDEGAVVELSGYDATRTHVWQGAYDQLVILAKASGRRNPDGDRPDQRWNWMKWVATISFLLGLGSIVLSRGWFAFGLMPLAVGTFIGFLIARGITPRQETVASATFLAKVRGLERVLDSDPAAARRELAQQLGLPAVAVMATMLPFAIVFKLEHAWMAQFPDLTPAELATMAWGVTNVNDLGSMVDSTSSFASSATTAPSSGSGSGGSSGGGGGGGGGGSW